MRRNTKIIVFLISRDPRTTGHKAITVKEADKKTARQISDVAQEAASEKWGGEWQAVGFHAA